MFGFGIQSPEVPQDPLSEYIWFSRGWGELKDILEQRFEHIFEPLQPPILQTSLDSQRFGPAGNRFPAGTSLGSTPLALLLSASHLF